MPRPAKRSSPRKSGSGHAARKRKSTPKRWSNAVTKRSDALDLDAGVFT
jgi:hypothetical protein